MKELSYNETEKSRTIKSLIMRRIAETGQSCVAAQYGISNSTVSREHENWAEQVSGLLSAIGLTVHDDRADLIDPDEHEAISVLARKYLNKK